MSDVDLDKFDLDTLKLGQDSGADLGVKRLLTTVPVRKPHRQWWVRCHSDPEYSLTTALLPFEEDKELYLLTGEVRSEVVEAQPYTLVSSITRQGSLFLWPLRLPAADGSDLEWWQSARQASELAKSRWIRLAANLQLGYYDISEARESLPEPSWPQSTFQDIVATAFRHRCIDNVDHPVLRQLEGRA